MIYLLSIYALGVAMHAYRGGRLFANAVNDDRDISMTDTLLGAIFWPVLMFIALGMAIEARNRKKEGR